MVPKTKRMVQGKEKGGRTQQYALLTRIKKRRGGGYDSARSKQHKKGEEKISYQTSRCKKRRRGRRG